MTPLDRRPTRIHSSTTALLLGLLGATLVVCACAPAAGAAVIAESTSGFAGGPALASDGRVVVGERRANGALRILAIDPATHAATQLAEFGAPADPQTYTELTLAGTGGIVTAALSTFHTAPRPTSDEEQASPILLETRTMTVLPTVATLGRCTPKLMLPAQLAAAGGDDFVASIGDDCAFSRSAVRLRTAGATITILSQGLPADASSVLPEVSDLRASGPMVAWVETGRSAASSQLVHTLVVARGSTGQVLLRASLGGFPLMLGLGSDGTVALTRTITDFPCAVGIVSPAAPSLRRFALAPPLCVNWNAPIAVAGGRFVYAAGGGFGVSDLDGSVHALAEATGTSDDAIGGSPVAFDGRTAFVVRSDCDADRLLAVDVATRGTPPAPLAAARTRCPVRRAGPGRLHVGPHGGVRIALRCPQGCRGTLRLVQQRKGGRERIAAATDYVAAAGGLVVRPQLARFARGLAGCSGGLKLSAVLFAAGERRRGLGDYRVVSRARCRRSGGPPFTAAVAGSRP
ncbi:MAG: hypothetical protein QOE31_1651 [Solirubrobacteraceae bacterium]|jgi:hypothetical protein|nr:hypothetical protein [Solirubrobacteraceae bacterium]